jgi:hypothetical protein
MRENAPKADSKTAKQFINTLAVYVIQTAAATVNMMV